MRLCVFLPACLALLALLSSSADGGSYQGLRWFWRGSRGDHSNYKRRYLSRGGSTDSDVRRALVVLRVKDGNGRTVYLQPAATKVTRRIVPGIADKNSATEEHASSLHTGSGVSSRDVIASQLTKSADSAHQPEAAYASGVKMPRPPARFMPPAADSIPQSMRPKSGYLPPSPSSQYLPPADYGMRSLDSRPAQRRPQALGKGDRPSLAVPRPGVAGVAAPGQVVKSPEVTGLPPFTGVPDLKLPAVTGRPQFAGVPGTPDFVPAGGEPPVTPAPAPPGREIRRNLSGRADGSLFFGILPIPNGLAARDEAAEPSPPPPQTVLSSRPGKCPLVDMTMCPVHSKQRPASCSNDGQCPGSRRCCYNPCEAHNSCMEPEL